MNASPEQEVCPKLNRDRTPCNRKIAFIPEGQGVISGWHHEDGSTDHHPIPASWVRTRLPQAGREGEAHG